VRAVVAARPDKRIAFLCHSRGGLLLRLFLQRSRSDVALLRRITGAVTLHSPHQGSGVADLVSTIHTLVLAFSYASPWLIGSTLAPFLAQLHAPAIYEMRTDSAFLAQLRASEATPLPAQIPIHTFGGTAPRLTRVRAWWFDTMSAVPQWAAAREPASALALKE